MTRIDYAHSNSGGDRLNRNAPNQSGSFSLFSSYLNESLVSQNRSDVHDSDSPDSLKKKSRDSTSEGLSKNSPKRRSDSSLDQKLHRPDNDRDPNMVFDRGIGERQQFQIAIESELLFTPARSILHVADLERIIASMRSHRTGELSSITINLKHAVFEGLEIRISQQKGRSLTAEFIASSEAVRNVVQERSSELIRLFADRGIKLGTLDVSLGEKESNQSNDKRAKTGSKKAVTLLASSPDSKAVSNESATSYLT